MNCSTPEPTCTIMATLITPLVLNETVFIAHTIYMNHSYSEQMGLNWLDIDILAICTIKFNSLHQLYSFINVFNVSPAKLIGTYACIDSSSFFSPLLFLSLFRFSKPANAKNKNQTKTGTTPRRNLVWFSLISNAEHFLPSSKRTNVHPKKCRSLSLNSWAWNLPLSVTSS